MHRFFVLPDCIVETGVNFPPDISRQICRVLRLRPEQTVVVLDNQGYEYDVSLADVTDKESTGIITARRIAIAEPACHLALFLCLSQREKFEWMLQKCTEIGATSFTPVISERTLVRETADAEKKYERWNQILREAAEQSHRGRIPELHPPQTLPQALKTRRSFDLALLPWEGEQTTTLHAALTSAKTDLPGAPRLALMIGPEGGLAEAEARLAQQDDWLPVTLGPRILRMETAAMAAAAIVLYALG